MKCPVCARTLSEVEAGSIRIDVCREGCGGVWFDKNELQACDEASELFPRELLRVKPNADVVTDRSRQRYCPRCSAQPLHRCCYDSQYNIEVDECMSCGGYWLDLGELEQLRRQDEKEVKLQRVVDSFMSQATGAGTTGERAERLKAFLRLIF